ncbi:MAG TPA: amidase [Nocardioides sp.]|nr:amidase [Nocardioides sp.]
MPFLPLAVKNLIAVKGMPAAVGSPAFPEAYPEDAAVVESLRAAGFTVVGQTNSPQLGMGVRTEGTWNPWDTAHIVGGSSGGSAAAVASGVVDVALGTDTGGSIRIPAALCGVVGFRPTSGTLSRQGVVPFSSTFDQVGPVTSTVALARAISQVLWESASGVRLPAARDLPPAQKRILGVPWSYVRTHTSTPMLREFERLLGVLESLGFQLSEVELEPNEVWVDLQREVRVHEACAVHQDLLRDPRVDLSSVARATLEGGPAITPETYRAALDWRSALIRRWQGIFDDLAAVVTPTTPVVAPRVDTDWVDLAESGGSVDEVLGRFTRPWSTLGLPSINVPTGRLVDGLPAGLQFASGEGRDHLVLDLGELVEQQHSPLQCPRPVSAR